MQQAMYCNSDQAKLNAKQIIDNTMKTSGLSSASSLPNAQLVECLCQSSWDLNDPSFAAVAGMAMTAMSSGDMDPAALFDKIEVMLPLMGSASNLCSPTCKVAIQAYISAATEMDTAAYTQAGLSQEVAAIAGMADTAQEVECLCAFDLTSMLHDLKPLLLQAMALSKQAAAASQQPALLGQDGHGQYQPALLGQGGHGQYQGQGQGPGIGRRLQGLPSSKADVAALDTELGSPLRTMLADEQSAVGGMFDSQSAMLGGIAAMYIVKKATSPGGMCPSMCTAAAAARRRRAIATCPCMARAAAARARLRHRRTRLAKAERARRSAVVSSASRPRRRSTLSHRPLAPAHARAAAAVAAAPLRRL